MQIGSIIRNAAADMQSNPLLILFASLLAIVPSVYADLNMDAREGFQFVSLTGLFLIAFQIILTHRSLVRRNLITVRHDPPRGFFPRVLGQGILWSLAILAGLVALVVPALILFVRWSVTLPALIAEDSGVIDSFRRSWALTRGKFWSILGTFLIVCVPAIVGIVVASVAPFVLPISRLAESILINTMASLSQILWWFVQIEIYSRLYKSSSPVS